MYQSQALEIGVDSDSRQDHNIPAKIVLLINNVSFNYFTFSGYEVIRGHRSDVQMKDHVEAVGITDHSITTSIWFVHLDQITYF